MNTKWEEDWNKIFHSVEGVKHFHPEIEDEIKLFIKDQITKAYEEGRAHHSFNGKDPLEVRGVYLNNLVKEAQQEIAEQILQDIPDDTCSNYCNGKENVQFKDQLRKKYL